MTRISTHVLDTARGVPARDVSVHLERHENTGEWRVVASAHTDDDGRCNQLLPEGETLAPGIYRLAFDTASYFTAQGVRGLYPIVQITFAVRDGETHFHIPLLLSPNSYTTYRGS
ncbi:MAG: hydroxyisourate hydrolase [Candidatus Acidiferrales bacterium]|jgi:5-hydroxyisourate hydrolase